MNLKHSLLMLTATVSLFGATVTTASAATIQALPNQEATRAAHNAVEGSTDNSSETADTTQSTSSSATVANDGETATTSQAKAVVNLAKKLATMNIPYVWGGESLHGMDCSGLTDYVYAHAANIHLGHYTVTQEGQVNRKPVSQAKPGDLLFWGSAGATHHVAIYIGNNQFVAAPQPGQNVDVETISSYFMPSFAGTVK
ncbi:NlpC/P60 family hydrolase [Secundilactobacillus silagincola]|uniref:NlpC/P60 family hydrolase n=1 Tax=Secundilactobacillus silagincola TaxID=1714681 RepID=A0A1Z5H4T3_9LACO|nr:C40 family peptidase [Secundilactobacillus silagincola]GAT18307.1 NlpC/P60 family hydrolase [Secundilactobacillus silagincola]